MVGPDLSLKEAPVTLTRLLDYHQFLFRGIDGAPLVLVTNSFVLEEPLVSYTKSDTLLQALNVVIQQAQDRQLRSYLVS